MKIKKEFIGKILISFIAALGCALCFFPAQAVEYGQMGGRPTNSDPDVPGSEAWFIYSIPPGQMKEDSVTVLNLYEQDWDALIYAADSVKSAGGGFALKQESEEKREVGSWVIFYPDPRPSFSEKFFEGEKKIFEVCSGGKERFKGEYGLEEAQVDELSSWCEGKREIKISLKSQEKREIPFVITIPEGADVGEHTGGILIQKVNKDESQDQSGSRVMLTTRVGVRIYETVPGDIIKKLSFRDFSIKKNYSEFFMPWDAEKKAKFREYVIGSVAKNEGNASIDFSEKIIIHNKLFGKDEIIEGRTFQVLRGDDFSSTLAWKAPGIGWLSFSKQYEYADTNNNVQIITSETVNKLFLPWREIVIIVMVLVLLALVYGGWRYYHKRRYGGVGWEQYEVSESESVVSLADKFDISWKILAKTNDIKAPYLLEAGRTILVPKGFGSIKDGEIEKEKKEEEKDRIDGNMSEKIVPKTISIKKEDVFAAKMEKVQAAPEENEKVETSKSRKGLYLKIVAVALVLVSLAVIIIMVFIKGGVRIRISQQNNQEKTITEITNNLPSKVPSNDVQRSEAVSSEEENTNSDNAEKREQWAEKKDLSIVVLNGGAAPGMAGKVKIILESGGKKVSDARNAQERNYSGTNLYYVREAKEVAETVKELLDKNGYLCNIEESDKHKQDGDIVVLLGK